MAGKNIVYLLGAGASCEIVPVLKRFTHEMSDTLIELSKIDKGVHSFPSTLTDTEISKIEEELKEFQMSLRSDWDWFFAEVNKHKSIDTLAKRLFLRNDPNLKLLKDLMSLFLSWIQTPQKYDQRYDSFLATVLTKENNKIKFPDNIKFISWNYDMQFEISLTNYLNVFRLTDIHRDWQIFPNCYHASETCEKPIMVKLNGTAGLYFEEKQKKIHAFNEDLLIEKDEIINQKEILRRYQLVRNNFNYENMIQFAWEETEISKQSMKISQQYLMEADAIVIVGYSFPIFNKEKDKELLDALKKNRKRPTIYVQDPNAEKILQKLKANFIEIKKRVEYQYGDGPIFLVPETNTDQF